MKPTDHKSEPEKVHRLDEKMNQLGMQLGEILFLIDDNRRYCDEICDHIRLVEEKRDECVRIGWGHIVEKGDIDNAICERINLLEDTNTDFFFIIRDFVRLIGINDVAKEKNGIINVNSVEDAKEWVWSDQPFHDWYMSSKRESETYLPDMVDMLKKHTEKQVEINRIDDLCTKLSVEIDTWTHKLDILAEEEEVLQRQRNKIWEKCEICLQEREELVKRKEELEKLC